MYLTVTVGLWLTALSLILIGPVPNSTISQLSSTTQMAMAVVMFCGTTVKIHGFLSGTKYFMPHRDIRDCYAQAAWAIIATNTGLAVYVLAIISYYGSWLLSTLGGALGLSMIAGAIWNAWDFYVEIHRLTRQLHKEAQSGDGLD